VQASQVFQGSSCGRVIKQAGIAGVQCCHQLASVCQWAAVCTGGVRGAGAAAYLRSRAINHKPVCSESTSQCAASPVSST
jgi:hypothetical protein